MRIRSIASVLCFIAVGSSARAAAADLAVVSLRSGETIVGTIRKDGDKLWIRPASLSGAASDERAIASDEILSNESQADLRAQCRRLLDGLQEHDTFRALQTAKLAVRAQLRSEALNAAERALSAGAETSRIDETLKPLAASETASLHGSLLATRFGALLQDAAAAQKTAGDDAPDRAWLRYARLALAAIPQDERTPQVEQALRSKCGPIRALALESQAGEKKGPEMAADARLCDSLMRYALYDGDPGVRTVATNKIKEIGDSRQLQRFENALWEKSAYLRFHSAEALGALGKVEAAPALVNRLSALKQAAGVGGHPTASLFIGEQRSYVSDYNVEVAQASAIAEPVISTLQSGVVLDARVMSVQIERLITEEVRVVRGSLAKLAGRDLGEDPKAWAAWLKEAKGPRTPAPADK